MKDVIERRGQQYFAVTHYDNGLQPNRRMLDSEIGQTYVRVALEDYGKRFWPTILPQEIAVMEGRRSWRYSSTTRERQAFVDVWRELSTEEKLAYAGYHCGNWGETARALGFTDIQTIMIGLCGSEVAIPHEESDALSELKNAVESKLVNGLIERGVESAGKRLHNIIFGISEIVTEDLGDPQVGTDEWKEVYKKRRSVFHDWLLSV